MNKIIRWMTVENPPGFKKQPKWKRSVAIDENDVAYAPAIICGNEKQVFLCAGFDGEPCLMLDNHPFFRTAWLKQEFPDTAEIMDKIELRLKEALNAPNASSTTE